MSANPRCPNCGDVLDAVELRPQDTPPWLCVPCARGWWNVELQQAAHWQPATRDFGVTNRIVHAESTAERDDQPRGQAIKVVAAVHDRDRKPK